VATCRSSLLARGSFHAYFGRLSLFTGQSSIGNPIIITIGNINSTSYSSRFTMVGQGDSIGQTAGNHGSGHGTPRTRSGVRIASDGDQNRNNG